jgi:alpha-galactosidase
MALSALERYGDALGREMKALPYERIASGWCSWYYYWHGVREEDITANLESLTETRRELPVGFVQIDDGYQADIGDWLTVNDKFPHGLKWLVDQIHERGFKAGLWLAPFLAGANSRLYAEHPDWMVQHRPGKPSIVLQNWGQDCYALDLTRADVISWIERIFTTICEECGFDYLKIDFIYAGAVDGLRHDPNVTRAQAYRRGLAAVRRAAGDRFVLGCGNPIGPSVGLIDGSRVGPDVGPYWQPVRYADRPGRSRMSEPACLNSIRNSITRSWMHGRLWMNDPDCLLVRDSETALTLEEVRSLATVIGMTGGMVLDSDDLTRLPDERRRIISMLLPVYGQAAAPLDLFASETPALLELDCGEHRLLAAFNWADAPAEVRVALTRQRTHVFEAWEREYLGMRTASVSLNIPPHGCRLLSLRRALDRPQLIGSTFHLLQGACEVAREEWDGEALHLSLRPVACRDGAIFVHMPGAPGIPVVECRQPVKIEDLREGLWEFQLEFDEPLDMRIRFATKEGRDHD